LKINKYKLKPCPFLNCGNKDIAISRCDDGYYAFCVKCGARTMPYKKKEDVFKYWNNAGSIISKIKNFISKRTQ